MLATVQGVLQNSSSSFFVQNGTNLECELQFFPTPSATSGVQTPATAKVTTTGTPSKTTSHIGALAGGIAGGAALVILAIGAIAFVRLRRRQGSALSPMAEATLTPFNPTLTYTSPLEQQRSYAVGMPAAPSNHGPSSSRPLFQSSPRAESIPVDLSAKELARLRSRAMHTQPNPVGASSSSLQPTLPPLVTTVSDEVAPARTSLQSEVEYLRLEVERLRAQQVHVERFEAPPSYGEPRPL